MDQPTMSAVGAQPKARRHTHHSAPPQLAQIQEQPGFSDDTHQSLAAGYSGAPQKMTSSSPTKPAERQRRHTHYTMMDTGQHVSQKPSLGAIDEESASAARDKKKTIVPSKTPRLRAFSTPDSVARDRAVKQFYHDKMVELRRARNEVTSLAPAAAGALLSDDVIHNNNNNITMARHDVIGTPACIAYVSVTHNHVHPIILMGIHIAFTLCDNIRVYISIHNKLL